MRDNDIIVQCIRARPICASRKMFLPSPILTCDNNEVIDLAIVLTCSATLNSASDYQANGRTN